MRTKGWQMPSNSMYVGRPTKWGNPYKWGPPEKLVKLYESYLRISSSFLEEIKKELKGKNLGCWCPLDQPCHADILLKVANEESKK